MYANGEIRKVHACKVKPHELIERKQEDSEKWYNWTQEDEEEKKKEEGQEGEKEKEESDDVEMKEDGLKDVVGAKYLKMCHNVCFLETAVYSVEVPVREHGKVEVTEAKQKEVENLEMYEVFEEVDDIGQETIGSRWIVTQKEKHDGQKQQFKARLVARGFQEREQPQADAPTVAKESFKILMALAANQNFKVVSMDIRAAFLQANKLDREVFMRPPDDIKKEGKVWKLLKPLYGLDDASRKFWLKVRETLTEFGLKTMPGDEAFYYENTDGKLKGAVLSHVDDFIVTGEVSFIKKIVEGIQKRMTVSKVEEPEFRLT